MTQTYIPQWSFSKLGDFEACKLKAKLKHLDRIPEPPRPLPAGKTEHANERGTRIHDSCERYIRGLTDYLAPEAGKHFGPQIDLLRTLFSDGLVSLEGEWGMDRGWETTGWDGQWLPVQPENFVEIGAPHVVMELPTRGSFDEVVQLGTEVYIWEPSWLRLKLDALVHHDEHTATVIDFKSGRKFGNEIKHAEQLQLYQLVTFLRYPELETIYAELWYLDQDAVTSVKYTRAQGLRYLPNFDRRGEALTTTTDWPPNANAQSCRWCPYGPWDGGTKHCSAGVKAPAPRPRGNSKG